jgi:hypothetical protein
MAKELRLMRLYEAQKISALLIDPRRERRFPRARQPPKKDQNSSMVLAISDDRI